MIVYFFPAKIAPSELSALWSFSIAFYSRGNAFASLQNEFRESI